MLNITFLRKCHHFNEAATGWGANSCGCKLQRSKAGRPRVVLEG